jgi:hypothetical protein
LEEVVATCDRLLGDLDRGRERLDARTVLVVSEAAMVGSRKLTRLLEHAEQAQAKVVLVGDARQLAAIDAGGGFHASASASAPASSPRSPRWRRPLGSRLSACPRGEHLGRVVVRYAAPDRLPHDQGW